jgi:hypothetical protein
VTRLIADAHLHLYPCYDLAAAVAALADNLGRHGDGVRAGFLAERSGCRAFAAIRDGSLALRAGAGRFETTAEEGALILRRSGSPPLYLFSGRQLATAERIEVLALTVDAAIPDGLPAAAAVDAVLAAGGVPVLPWSPGKWWFARGRLVRELLSRHGPEKILVGDTAMRPSLAGEPAVMREARRLGCRVVAGTDPLPFAGEEALLGTYASVLEGDFDERHPVASARRLLQCAAAAGTAGTRNGWLVAARRWWGNARASRA